MTAGAILCILSRRLSNYKAGATEGARYKKNVCISHNVSHHDGCRGVACAAFVYAAAPFTRQPQLMVPVSTLGLLHAPAEVTSGVPAKVATVPTALSASAASLMIFFF